MTQTMVLLTTVVLIVFSSLAILPLPAYSFTLSAKQDKHQDATTYGGIQGFDCSNSSLSATTLSLYDPVECSMNSANITTESEYIQVLQKKRVFDVPVYVCKVEIIRTMSHCGMHSHSSEVQNGYKYILRSLSMSECQALINTGSYRFNEAIYTRELSADIQNRGKILVAGSLEGTSCKGGQFVTSEGSWRDVLVYYEYTIHYTTAKGMLTETIDSIDLPGALRCTFSDGTCMSDNGLTYTWSTTFNADCVSASYAVLFSGMVNKTYDKSNNGMASHPLFSTMSKDSMFVIKATGPTTVCGYPGYTTDHTHISIVVSPGGMEMFRSAKLAGKEVDILTHLTSKITAVEHHVAVQVEDLYRTLMYDLCQINRKILSTQLIMARLYPDEFAAQLMGSQGYTAVVAGEVLYLIKCAPTHIQLRNTDECYQEIPVIANGENMFMSPITRIIQPAGTQTPCSPIMPPKYKFMGEWYTIDRQLREAQPPMELSTNHFQKWEYRKLPDLMTSGLYSEAQLQDMRDAIYDTSMHRSSISYLSRLAQGRSATGSGIDVSRLLSPDVIDSALSRYWAKMSGWASSLGNITSTMIGFWMVWKLIKFIIDTAIHGQILYDIYGCGWQLVAALWDSVTTWLSHKHSTRPVREESPVMMNAQLSYDKEIQQGGNQSLMHPTCPSTLSQQSERIYPTLSGNH